jgi:hypothetical protein
MRTLSLLALGLVLPTLAHADTVVITPLLPDGIDAKVVGNIHQLMASELDFATGVDNVVDLPQRPTTLNNACLVSTRCLGTIAGGNGGQRLISGIIHSRGTDLGLELLLYDTSSNSIVRRKEWVTSSDPTELANGMTAIISELLTGQDPNAAAAAAPTVAAFEDGEDEDDFDFDGDPLAPVVVPVAAPVAAAAPTTDDDLAAISFGGSPADITVEEIDSIQFGAPPPGGAAPAPTTAAAAPAPAPAVTNLDDDAKVRSRTPRQPQERSAAATIERPGAETLQFTLRGGYSRYYRFGFVTVGGEVAVPVVSGLHILAGMESYGTSRTLPPDVAVVEGDSNAWETIFPLNTGAMYKFTGGLVQPYAGADLIFVQYYKDDIGSDWAAGVRARVGADFMLITNFGLNLNVAMGTWSGKNWPLIEQGVGSSGLLPQVSAGTVLAF